MNFIRSLAVVAVLASPYVFAQPATPKLPAKLFVNEIKTKPIAMAQAAAAKPGSTVTVRGVVDADGFAPEKAAFVLSAESGDGRATVRVVDKSGKVLTTGIKGHRGLYPGAVVVVTGARAAGAELGIDAASVSVTKAALPEGLYAPAAEPSEKTQWVEDARKTAKTGAPITIRGTIGGGVEPFVTERAVFTIIGKGLKSCADMDKDHCKTPWDYCCETKEDIAAHAATIQVVDPAGQVLRVGVKHGDVKELADIIVEGTVATANDKTLIVNATKMWVVKK